MSFCSADGTTTRKDEDCKDFLSIFLQTTCKVEHTLRGPETCLSFFI